MHKAEHNLKAIMHPAYGTHHRVRTIRRNEIQLTQRKRLYGYTEQYFKCHDNKEIRHKSSLYIDNSCNDVADNLTENDCVNTVTG